MQIKKTTITNRCKIKRINNKLKSSNEANLANRWSSCILPRRKNALKNNPITPDIIEKLEKLGESTSQAVFAFTFSSEHEIQFLYVNELYASYFGVSPNTIINDSEFVLQFIPPETRIAMRDDVKRMNDLSLPFVRTDEGLLRVPGKSDKWIEFNIIPLAIPFSKQFAWYGLLSDITDKKNAEVLVQNEIELNKLSIDLMLDGIVILDRSNQTILEVNPSYLNMSGYTREELIGSNLRMVDKTMPEFVLQDHMRFDWESDRFEATHTRKDGSTFDIEICSSVSRWKDKCVSFCVCRDISSRKFIEAQLLNEKKKLSDVSSFLKDLVDSKPNPHAVMQTIVDHALIWSHSAAATIFILDKGKLLHKIGAGALAHTSSTPIDLNNSFSGACLTSEAILYCRNSETDGRINPAYVNKYNIKSMMAAPLFFDGKPGGVLVVTSPNIGNYDDNDIEAMENISRVVSAAITQAAQFEENETLLAERTEALASLQKANLILESLATTDGLTGIKNHRAFQEELRIEFNCAERYRTELSLIMLDIDHFKQYNDAYGHMEGDQVLRDFAGILQQAFRVSDFVARYGGEEFVIILPNTDIITAAAAAERSRSAIEHGPWKKHPVTASFGVAAISAEASSPTLLIQKADSALFCAKSDGRNRVVMSSAAGVINF